MGLLSLIESRTGVQWKIWHSGIKTTSLRFWFNCLCVLLCLIVKLNKEQWLKIWIHCQPKNKIFISGTWQIHIQISFQTRSALKALKHSVISRPLRLLQSDGIRHHSARSDRCLFFIMLCYESDLWNSPPPDARPFHHCGIRIDGTAARGD